MSGKRFNVVEVEIKNPSNRRIMKADCSEEQAEDFIRIAVMRRGVETHFFTMESSHDHP